MILVIESEFLVEFLMLGGKSFEFIVNFMVFIFFFKFVICNGIFVNFLLGCWRLCVELFGWVFLEDVGFEFLFVLNELGRFDVKEIKFR